jgi:nitrite reductase/ring-hydroxylating ferredoxin subunit
MKDFVKVANLDEIKEGKMKIFYVEGEEIVLAKVDGKIYAFTNFCSHENGPLGEGSLNGKIVTCPWHLAQFDITTGKVVNVPFDTEKYGKVKDIETFEVKIEGKDVFVKI